MKNETKTFLHFVNQALASVEDPSLARALYSGFEANHDRLDRYADTYRQITSRPWTTESLCTFFCGWRSPDGAAHAVSSIVIRLLQASGETEDAAAKDALLSAARHCGEIIVEDAGLGEMHGHPHHSKLYHRMASTICGSDDWRLMDRYLNPVTKEFSNWVGQKRPLAPDLMEAIEMMIMTEMFNTGEYNMMTPMWKAWLHEHMGYATGDANRAAAFLSVHCGEVEARHFVHATSALTLFAQATGRAVDYARIEALSREYVERACLHAERMASVLKPAPAPVSAEVA